jgi:hypothetical protein
MFLCKETFGAQGIAVSALCVEKEEVLLREVLPTEFGIGRSTVGQDQIETLKNRITQFVAAQRNVRFTKIAIKSMAARLPFYVSQGVRQVIDPQSDSRNSTLARERAEFAQTALLEIKLSKPELRTISILVESGLEGPVFKPTDLNDRFVTPMTPQYRQRVLDFFEANKLMFEEMAFLKSEDLLNPEMFQNLYQVKFKPFQGFRLEISGSKRCLEVSPRREQVIKQ